MERMRDVLRGSLARSLRELSAEDRLAAAWPVACGPSLAAHAELLHPFCAGDANVEHVLRVQMEQLGVSGE